MFFMIFSCNHLYIVRRFFIFAKNEGFILTTDKVFPLSIVQSALRLRRAYSNSLNFTRLPRNVFGTTVSIGHSVSPTSVRQVCITFKT